MDIDKASSTQTLQGPSFLNGLPAVAVLILATGLSLMVWLAAGNDAMPALTLDEWVVTDTISSGGFMDAVRKGHNGTPTYIQNLLWRIDYDHFNYEGGVGRWFQNGALVLGFMLLMTAIYKTGVGMGKTCWAASLFLLLWFSVPNSAHYGSWYVWRGVESSGILLLLGAALCTGLQIIRRGRCLDRHTAAYFVSAVVAAWLALYLYGGFAVLPVLLGLLALTSRDRRLWGASAFILVLFAGHFLVVHATEPSASAMAGSIRTVLFGMVLILTNLVYLPAYDLSGSAWTAGILASCLAVCGAAFGGWLLYALRASSEKRELRFTAAVLLGYPLLIALAIAYARLVHEADWLYATAWRYRNYSALFMVGLLLAAWSLPKTWDALPVIKRSKRAFTCLIMAAALLGGFISTRDYHKGWWMPALFQSKAVPFTLEPWALPDHNVVSHRRRAHASNYQQRLQEKGGNMFAAAGYKAYRSLLDSPDSAVGRDGITPCYTGWEPVTIEKLPQGNLVEIKGWMPGPWCNRQAGLIFLDAAGIVRGWGPRHRSGGRIWEPGFRQPDTGNYVWGYALVPPQTRQLQAVLIDRDGNWLCKTNPVKF